MSLQQFSGDLGEKEVARLVSCPNCQRRLMRLPKNYPLFDVQCTGCSFRAQVKTSNLKPAATIRGAGWVVIEKVLKAGYMIPPLIINFKWKKGNIKHQEIRFYPFIPKRNLRKYQLSATARRAYYKMFNYRGMDKLPYFILYKKPKEKSKK